ERVSGLFGCVDEVIINGVELPPTLSGRPPCYDCFSLDPNIYHVSATLDKYLEKNLIPLTLPTVFQDPDLEKLTFDFSFFYDRQESIINSLFMLVFSDNEDLSVEHRVWIYLTNNEVKMVASPSDEEPQDQGHSVTLPNLPRSRNTWHFIKLEMLFLGPTKVFLLRSKGEQSLPLMMLQPMRNLKAIYFGQDMVIKPKLLGPKLHSTPGRPFVGCFRDIRLRTNLDVATLRFPANIPGLLEGSLQHCPEFSGHIPLDDLQFTYSCASGPGGQHVNKTRSKVEVRFHVPSASWIPEPARARLLEKEAHRITKDSFFIIASDRTRKQVLNQADCLERIRRLVRECVAEINKPPPDPETIELIQKRKAKANESRLIQKKMSSLTKQYRQKPTVYDL
ncbi:hypothetical protein X801_02210, partial [Opisthorchis viverrini]